MARKIYLSALLACLAFAFSACSDDAPNAPSNDLVQVTFNVNPFNVSVEPMNAPQSRATSATGEKVNEIIYLIKNNETGKKWDGKQTLATSGDDFGTIKLWIPSGTYSVHIAAANGTNVLYKSYFNMERDNKGRTELHTYGRDVFGLFKSYNITAETQSIDLNLTRNVGQIILRLNDEIPADIESIKIQATSFLRSYPATGEQYASIDYLNFTPTISNGHMDEWSTYFVPQNNVVLQISVYGEGNAAMGTSEISVNVYKNKRTIIEGNLTDIITQRPFNITIDDAWGEDVVVPL